MSAPQINTSLVDRLGELYERYGRDFILKVHHELTEPTCPSAQIEDDDGMIVARADRDTIEDAINAALQIACDRLLDGKGGGVWPDALGTNPNDMTKPGKCPID